MRFSKLQINSSDDRRRTRMHSRCLAGAVMIAVATMSPAAHAAFDPQAVDKAIDKGIAYLMTQQQKDGSWETATKAAATHTWGGETAIVTYALLAAGANPRDPAVKKAIDWLEHEDLHGTYAVGLRAQVWHLLPEQAKTNAVIAGRERDKEFVLYSRGLTGTGKGFYGYSYGTDGGLMNNGAPKVPLSRAGSTGGDRSNSQYGVLGAWALEQAGAEIPNQYWAEEDQAWKADQNADGGWAYSGKNNGSIATMTAAGVATLFITQDYMMRVKSHEFDRCTGGVTNQNIENGLAWMDKHAAEACTGGGYGLYGIERIGVASGRKYFGTLDWYKVGAEALVSRQSGNGSWGAPHDCCFSILFLVRGRAPVMMNKLMYENGLKKQVDPWNERPRDSANLAKWMGEHALETTLNWQVVNLKVAVDELHDAPILYISGSEALLLSNQDIEKLRQFVEQGGMILGNADCGSKIFADSFKALGAKLFKYEFRKLPLSHPIFDEQFHAAKWKIHPDIEGLSNGVRELMVLIPTADPSHAWQVEATKTREESFQLAGNIFLYATGKENLTHKGETYIVHPEGAAGREIKVARIQAGDNWDPEPGAWRRLSAVMHNVRHVDLKVEPVKLGSGLLASYKIAHLTGTTRLILNPAEDKELKDFVDKGGTLIVDSAGGSAEFTESVDAALRRIWGAAGKSLDTPLPPTHLLLSTPGALANDVAYRTFAHRMLVGHLHEPRIRAIEVAAGRIGVFFSHEDITAGLVGEPVDGIVGYTPASATQLMSNMVMYADQGFVIAPPPSTQPAANPGAAPTTAPATVPAK